MDDRELDAIIEAEQYEYEQDAYCWRCDETFMRKFRHKSADDCIRHLAEELKELKEAMRNG